MSAGNSKTKSGKKLNTLKIMAIFGVLVFGFYFLVHQNSLFFNFKLRRNYKIDENLTLNDIFLSVKTSKLFEATRLPIILKTWFQFSKQQTWFFTDYGNLELYNQTNGHIISTNCSPQHNSKGLTCKMGEEYNYYIRSGKKWFCHFDDDNYVNVPRLVEVLEEYDLKQYWYLGKRSKKYRYRYFRNNTLVNLSFWFATGGAGFCISQTLAKKMYYLAGDNRFKKICYSVRFPDDVCIGFIISYATRKSPVELTQLSGFHSHLEPMKDLTLKNIREQISFSYSSKNILNIPGFNLTYDPTRFLSLHCFLFPYFEYCI